MAMKLKKAFIWNNNLYFSLQSNKFKSPQYNGLDQKQKFSQKSLGIVIEIFLFPTYLNVKILLIDYIQIDNNATFKKKENGKNDSLNQSLYRRSYWRI